MLRRQNKKSYPNGKPESCMLKKLMIDKNAFLPVGSFILKELLVLRSSKLGYVPVVSKEHRTSKQVALLSCSKGGLRIIVWNSWELRYLDVKTSYLQGKGIEGTVSMRPPKETKSNYKYRSLKTVHGLADASKQWYVTLKPELEKMQTKPILFDQVLVVCYDGL